jgi:FkbM family methyltransferase
MLRSLIQKLGYEVIKTKRSPDFESHLKNMIGRCQFDAVLDVGANQGQFAQKMRALGFQGPIFSFEPVESTFAGLEALARQDTQWKVFKLALGEVKEQRKINVFQSSDFSSLLKPSAFGKETFDQLHAPREELIDIDTLDHFFESNALGQFRRVLLKMDTQGFDLSVFRGGRQSMSHICALVSEISLAPIYDGMPNYHAALGEYEASGFAITGLYPVTRKDNQAIIEMDCVMVREPTSPHV